MCAKISVFATRFLVTFICALLTLSSLTWAEPQKIKRPLVFIPGALGSQLSRDGKIIWGDISSYSNIPKLALPMDGRDDGIIVDGTVDSIQIFWPFKIKQYDILYQTLRNIGYENNKNFFIFAYDWRRSNFDTARKFSEFVKNTLQLNEGKFDILAHSMGGLVAMIYLLEFNGKRHVENLITMGTPYFGSANAIQMLLFGWGGWKDFIAGGSEKVRKVAFSFPSIYELLPDNPLCCILGRSNLPKSEKKPISIFDESHWLQLNWLPSDYSKPEKFEFVKSSLKTAAKLRTMMRNANIGDVKQYRIAGDLIDTLGQIWFSKADGSITESAKFPGDGTVLVRSASQGHVQNAIAATAQHATIFDEEHFRITIDRILTDRIRGPQDYAGGAVLASVQVGRQWVRIDGFNISLKEPYLKMRQQSSARVEIRAYQPSSLRDLAVKAKLRTNSGDDIDIPVRLDVAETDNDGSVVTFIAEFTAPDEIGSHKIEVSLPGLGVFEDYFVTLKTME